MKKVKISTFNQAFTYGISYFSCIFSSSKGLPLKHFILKWQLLKKESKKTNMDFIWFLYGFYMVFIWILYGFYMDFIWFLYCFYMDFIWFFYN